MKETIYRTLDFTETRPNTKQQVTAKLLTSLKSIVQKEKTSAVITGSSHHNSKSRPAPVAAAGGAWHLATFSSPEQLAEAKEKQLQAVHEAMLRKELAKFRSEVEEKFRASETNRTYRFPKTDGATEVNGDNEDTVKIDDHFDCMSFWRGRDMSHRKQKM